MAQSRTVEADALKITAKTEKAVALAMPLLAGGMRTDKAEVDLAADEAVSISNLTVLQGLLQVRKGYGRFGSANVGTYLGVAQATFQAFYADGSYDEILVTTRSIYRYVIAAAQWQLLTYGVGYTTTAGVAAGVAVFPLNAVTNLANGQLFGVILDDGSQLIGTITNIAALNVTIDVPVPVGRSVANGAAVARGTALNGNTDGAHQPQIVVFPGKRWVILSNCVDPILYIEASVVKVLGGLPANTTCFGMIVSHEQLLLFHTIENGTALPYRIRASDQADPSVWTPGTGIAAIYDQLDTSDFIQCGRILGAWVIVYRERSIMRGTYFGLANLTWFWEYMVYDEGVFSQGAVVNVGAAQHFVVGTQGIYLYKGAFELESVGDAVWQGFISAIGTLNASARAATFVTYVPDYDEVWVFFPAGTDVSPRDMLRCMMERNAWFHATVADAMLGIAPFKVLSSETWATAVGIWSTDTLQWDTRALGSNVTDLLACPATAGGPLAVFDFAALADDTASVAWEIITRAFGDGLTKTRWDNLVITAKGGAVTIRASEDDGATWLDIGTYDFGTKLQPATVYTGMVPIASLVQFQLSGADPSFQLRAMGVNGVYESDW